MEWLSPMTKETVGLLRGGDHLRQAQGGPGSNAPAVQSGLGGEDIVVQPVVQVVSASVPPQEAMAT